MSQISLKSISGITSITTPTGVDNQFTLHTNNTNEALKLDGAGNLHFHNHLNITGISTASNFKTGTSNLHNTGLNVQDLDVDGHTNLDNVSIAGVTTITVTGGNGQLNVERASGAGLHIQAQSALGVFGTTSNHNLRIISNGNERMMLLTNGNIGINESSPDNKLHVRNDNSAAVKIGGEGGSAYYMEIGQLTTSSSPGLNATGSNASMLFKMNGSEKFRIGPSGQFGLSGTNYGTSGQVLTSQGNSATPTWTTVSGTTINNNADNRIITGSGTANTLEGEAGLTYNGSMLNVNSVTSENNAFRVYNTTTGATTFQINGEGNSFIGHTYPRSDANIDLGFHTGYRWRDVVLSGGIRFGSSSADDYLDDYEEGTYTPTINVGTFTTFLTHRYIKIGRLVHLHGGLIFHNNSSGTRVEISNIPFAQQTGQQFVGNVWLRRTSTGERNWNMILGEAGTNIMGIFRDSNGNDMGGHLSYSDFQHSSTYFNYSITYISAT